MLLNVCCTRYALTSKGTIMAANVPSVQAMHAGRLELLGKTETVKYRWENKLFTKGFIYIARSKTWGRIEK